MRFLIISLSLMMAACSSVPPEDVDDNSLQLEFEAMQDDSPVSSDIQVQDMGVDNSPQRHHKEHLTPSWHNLFAKCCMPSATAHAPVQMSHFVMKKSQHGTKR